MTFISEKGLVELKNYAYKSGGYSWLDNKINPFWLACVECVPMWVAPNLLTFMGFMFMLVSCSIGLIYDPSLNDTIPGWVFLFNGIGIFIYQTLDAIDGKQARRTGSSSPLGQLFDHGCDSFSMTFFILQVAQAAKIPCEDLFYISLGCQIMLWGANQREHLTGVLHTHLYNIGVTEVELLCIFIQLVSFALGPDAWHTSFSNYFHINSDYWLLRKIGNFKAFILVEGPIILSYILFGLYIILTNILYSHNKLKCILEWLFNGSIWWLQFVWFNTQIYSQLAGPIILHFGILTSLIVCKLIICSTTKDQFPTFHIEAVPFMIVSLAIHFTHPNSEIVRLLFISSLIITILMCIRFLYIVINQITDYLGIYCFSIKKKVKEVELSAETQPLK